MPTNELYPGRDTNELERQYAGMSDDALLSLRIEGGLTIEADAVLQAEMTKRSLCSRDIEEMKQWKEAHPLIPNKPPPPQRVILGYGVRYVGKKYLTVEDENKGIFVATRFIVVRGLALVPLGSYRVESRGAGLPQIENKVPIQWDQVRAGILPVLLSTIVGGSLGWLCAYLTDRK